MPTLAQVPETGYGRYLRATAAVESDDAHRVTATGRAEYWCSFSWIGRRAVTSRVTAAAPNEGPLRFHFVHCACEDEGCSTWRDQVDLPPAPSRMWRKQVLADSPRVRRLMIARDENVTSVDIAFKFDTRDKATSGPWERVGQERMTIRAGG